MTSTTQHPAPTTWPWGRLLFGLAALLLIRGIWLTWPERAVQEWPQPVGTHAMTFDPHGALVAAGYTNLHWYTPTNWSDPAASTPAATLQANGEITSFAISPDGQWVAIGTISGTLTLWTGAPNWHVVETMQPTSPAATDTSIDDISFSADGHSVCWVAYSRTAGWAQTISIRVWDRVTRQDRFTLTQTAQDAGARFDYDSARLSPDGNVIVLTSLALEVRRIDDNRRMYRLAPDPHVPDFFAGEIISPDQQWLVNGRQGQVTIRRFSDGAVVHEVHGSQYSTSRVAFSPDSRYLAVATKSISGGFVGFGLPKEPVTLYDVADWRVVQTFQGHIAGADGLAYSPAGQDIASFGDGIIRLWRVAPHNPFEPPFLLGIGLVLFLATVGRWIWQRRRPRA